MLLYNLIRFFYTVRSFKVYKNILKVNIKNKVTLVSPLICSNIL